MYSEKRDQSIRRVVAYKRLKIMENYTAVRAKKWLKARTRDGRLRETLIDHYRKFHNIP